MDEIPRTAFTFPQRRGGNAGVSSSGRTQLPATPGLFMPVPGQPPQQEELQPLGQRSQAAQDPRRSAGRYESLDYEESENTVYRADQAAGSSVDGLLYSMNKYLICFAIGVCRRRCSACVCMPGCGAVPMREHGRAGVCIFKRERRGRRALATVTGAWGAEPCTGATAPAVAAHDPGRGSKSFKPHARCAGITPRKFVPPPPHPHPQASPAPPCHNQCSKATPHFLANAAARPARPPPFPLSPPPYPTPAPPPPRSPPPAAPQASSPPWRPFSSTLLWRTSRAPSSGPR